MFRSNTTAHHRLQIARAISFIQANLDKPITLNEIADTASISRFHFSRSFRDLVGYSPMVLVRLLRLLRAVSDLREGKITIAAAADFAGYSSSTSFSRACRKLLGHSPGELRKEAPNVALCRGVGIIERPEMVSIGFRYAGVHGEACLAFDSLARAALANGAWRPDHGAFALVRQGEPFSASGRDWVEADVAIPIPTADSAAGVDGYDRITMPAGEYAVLKLRRDDRRALWQYNDMIDGALVGVGRRRREGPVIRWHHYDPALRPRALLQWSLLVPLEPRTGFD